MRTTCPTCRAKLVCYCPRCRGRQGGKAKTDAKTDASRANGQKGGRKPSS